MFCCGLVFSIFRRPRGWEKKTYLKRFLLCSCSTFYYFLLALVERIVDIKPVEIFGDLFGVHWISFPWAYFGRVVVTAHDTNYCEPVTVPPPWEIRGFKQQRPPRLGKHHLKSEFALLETLSRLFHLVQFVKCWQSFSELSSKGLYQSSVKEKENCCLVFLSTTKRVARAKLLFWQYQPSAFLPFSLTSWSSLLKLPKDHHIGNYVLYSPGRGTWVNFWWVCAAGLSEPLLHYSLFCGQL